MRSLEGYINPRSAFIKFNGTGYDNPMQRRAHGVPLYRNPTADPARMFTRGSFNTLANLRTPNRTTLSHLHGRMANLLK